MGTPRTKQACTRPLPSCRLDSWLGNGPTISHTSYQNRFPWGVLVSHDQKEILVENYICPSVPHTHTPINRLEGFPISFITDAHLPSKHSPWHEISSGEFSFDPSFLRSCLEGKVFLQVITCFSEGPRGAEKWRRRGKCAAGIFFTAEFDVAQGASYD